MYSYHDTRVNDGMIEIRPYPMSIAKIHVKTLAFVVLSAKSPFGAVNDCNSFNMIELDNRCVISPPFIVLITKCAFTRTRDV